MQLPSPIHLTLLSDILPTTPYLQPFRDPVSNDHYNYASLTRSV